MILIWCFGMKYLFPKLQFKKESFQCHYLDLNKDWKQPHELFTRGVGLRNYFKEVIDLVTDSE